ncbi:DUF4259 domain-containing protein [Gimesia sp.]|uniref:DUF4259 domain-containing protein n=1 Tax=Gimesia sp. TaxID=2024833 RepID=UPI000C6084F4|nr:DUF4259 domain-containing protein [Gimesia sp.]MAX40728.1 hypothetical protein [Gimesia sp.]HBL47335.1 hypothetical protein [Planctomycetaceae bacterium]|tara:strand:- start:3531 stop:3935 length:405 start_codon:yes stop_codon:yes gene_type:complete
MGAWGYRTFEDDSTCDWAEDLYDAEKAVPFLRESLTPEAADGYLEYDDCCSILGAAETVYALLFEVRDNPPEKFQEWVQNHRGLDVTDLKPVCVLALNRVLSENSELNELWSENSTEYPEWKGNVEHMIHAFNA